MEIVFRTPCTVHDSCDETSIHIVHNRKYAELTQDERRDSGHLSCERILTDMKSALLTGKSYTCNCGVVITLDSNRKLSPSVTVLFNALVAR